LVQLRALPLAAVIYTFFDTFVTTFVDGTPIPANRRCPGERCAERAAAPNLSEHAEPRWRVAISNGDSIHVRLFS
jgi:hypothetical protein